MNLSVVRINDSDASPSGSRTTGAGRDEGLPLTKGGDDDDQEESLAIHLGEHIAEELEARGMTAAELARAMGVDAGRVSGDPGNVGVPGVRCDPGTGVPSGRCGDRASSPASRRRRPGRGGVRPDVARRLPTLLDRSAAPPRPLPELSGRELEVLDLIAAGMKNADIARRLFLSPVTVRNHITNIFAKLDVADRSQAIVHAREAGLGRGSGS